MPDLIVPGTVPRILLLVCIDCLCGTYVDAPMPVVMQSWGDLPLPDGWVMTARKVEQLGRTDHVAIPQCPRCAAAAEQGENALGLQQDFARDLKDDWAASASRKRPN